MKELVLDGAKWHTNDDVYDSFFHAVGAPPWHGRNFDALNDSICTGEINAVEVPYRVVIENYSGVGVGAHQLAADFMALLRELTDEGCPVEVVIRDRINSSGVGS